MRFKLISCEVLFREMCDACAHSPHQVDLEFLPKGLHDLGRKPMAAKVQEAVDRTPEGVYEAILLGYGLCGNGLDGLTARHTRLVLPRAHACIALLMGSRERYRQYFEENPGTYYRSTGSKCQGSPQSIAGSVRGCPSTARCNRARAATPGAYAARSARRARCHRARSRAESLRRRLPACGPQLPEPSPPSASGPGRAVPWAETPGPPGAASARRRRTFRGTELRN